MSEAVVPGCCTQRGHLLPGSWLISQGGRETRPFRLQDPRDIRGRSCTRAERARVGSIHADATLLGPSPQPAQAEAGSWRKRSAAMDRRARR